MLLPPYRLAALNRSARVLLVLASGLAYLVAFWALRPVLGPDASILSVVPVIVTAGLLGFWPGVLTGALLIPVNSFLLVAPGETLWDLMWRYRLGHVAGLVVGGVVGLLGDVARRFRVQSQALAHEIAERRQAEAVLRDVQATLEERVLQRTAALQESEARYRQIYESNRVIQLLVDPETLQIVDGNAAAAAFYGYDRAALAGMPIAQINCLPVDEIRTRIAVAVTQAHTTHRFRHRLANGEVRAVEVDASPIELSGRHLMHVLVRDISEQSRYEAVLQRYRLLSEHARDIILFVRAADGRLLEANAAAVAAYGYAEAELLNLTIHALRDADTQTLIPGQLQQASAAGALFETVHRRKDGSTFPVEVSSRGLDLDGERVLLSIVRDISARQQTEAALRQSEQRFQLFMQHFPGLAYIKDAETRVLFVNQGFETYLQISPADILGKVNAEIFPPDFAEPMTAADRRVLQTGGSEMLEETFAGRTWATYKFAIPQAGRPSLLGGLTLDITERKAMEQALVSANQRLERILEGIHDGFLILDHDWRYTYVNTAAAASGFTTREVLLGQRIWDLAPGEVGGAFYQVCLCARDEGLASTRTDAYYDYGERGAKWYNLAVYPFEDGVAVHYRDITERKRAEQALAESERRFRVTLELSPLYAVVLDTAGRITFANSRLAQAAGCRPEALHGQDWFARFVPPELDLRSVFVDCVQRDGFPAAYENEIVLPSGERRQVLWTNTNLRGAAGEITGVASLGMDVTEPRRLEQVLRESEAQLRLFYELPFIGMAITSPKTKRWVRVNERLAEILGYPREILVQKTWAEMTHPDDLTADVAEFERVMSGASDGYRMDKRFVRPDGALVYATIDVRCVRAADGSVDFFVATVQDIGDRKRIEVELERRVAERTTQLEVANRELQAFAYSVSHDLRAPLRAIDGFSLALLEDCGTQLDAVGQDYLRRVRQAAQQMGQLIDALLLLSRVTRQEVRRQPVDLSVLAQSAAQDLPAGEPARQAVIDVQPNLAAVGDPRLMSALLTNLLGNAWKFTRGRPVARIEVGLALVQGERAFFVRDNGVGFDPAYAARLFQPFQRLHDTAAFEGTGIGLATVQRIVQRHGGRVWAEGCPGQGATFYFTLPD